MDKVLLRKSVIDFLAAIGENPNREGLKETPDRIVRMWEEFENDKQVEIKTFKNPNYNQLVVKANIRFHSFCEHHCLPFFGTVDIAYLPSSRLVGISKLSRIVRKFASKLNIQERLTNEIAEFIQNELRPKGVMVIVNATHLCEQMRGVRNSGIMITSALKGKFHLNPTLKNEVMALIQNEQTK